MDSLNLITLTAFVQALEKLSSPLPPDIQAELNQIGQDLAKNLAIDNTNIDKLYSLIDRYEPLQKIYREERKILQKNIENRNKALPPLPLSNEENQELINIAVDRFTASDSVAAAKQPPQQNLLQKIWRRIKW